MTHPTQEDEGLRRVLGDHPTDAVRCLLRQIAQRLRDERPADPMRESVRLALALTYSARRFGADTGLAHEAERQLLGQMPRIDRDESITRGEYALILDRVAAGTGR
jgi:hypothetical protein